MTRWAVKVDIFLLSPQRAQAHGTTIKSETDCTRLPFLSIYILNSKTQEEKPSFFSNPGIQLLNSWYFPEFKHLEFKHSDERWELLGRL